MQKLFSSLALTALAFSAQAATSLPVVQEAPLRAHLAFLSNDLLEGRGTGQRGADLTVAYLESQARLIGLQPLRGNSFRQSVQIAGVKSLPQDSSLRAMASDGKAVPLAFGPDWVWATGDSRAAHTFDAPLVFAGYGVTAPEEGWNDFKGADVKGKIIVVMVNDPQPTEAEPNRFGGKALTYYGRWTYKFEEAKRQGAAGVLLIHTKPSASYAWNVVQSSWSGSERFQLADRTAGTPLQGWLTEDAARRLFAAGGQDLDALRAKAESKDFQAVDLHVKLTGEMKSGVRKVEQFNIAGMVPGTDAKLKEEAVIYSGHWDHLGKQGEEKAGVDTIYNGAVDNASGTAGLLAMAQEAVKKPAKRTQIFLWVAAEEQGLLGSAAYAADPLWPLNKTAAALNLDSLNFVGATRDMGAQGSERTELGAMAATVAKAMGLQIAAARPDLAGGYFRSDHFSFAKVGVPAFSINGGRDFVKDPEASKAKAAAYGPRYHQVTDEYDASWDLSGMTQQAQFTLNLGQAVANAPKMPAWKAGDAFGKVREAAAK